MEGSELYRVPRSFGPLGRFLSTKRGVRPVDSGKASLYICYPHQSQYALDELPEVSFPIGLSKEKDMTSDKKADLAGPGIGNYEELEKILPKDYRSLLNPKETQRAIYAVKKYIEENLCKELNLMMVQVPLIVDVESGVNDMLDRDGSRTPIQFHISNDYDKHPVDAQVVQAATKWKRMALKQLGMKVGEGICTDMRAVRKDYFLDHDHSAYVDQWDWERVVASEQRNLAFLKEVVKKIWKVLKGAEKHVQELFPQLKNAKYPNLPDEITFLHAEDILAMYPDLPRKQRETLVLQKYPAVFIIGIGWPLKDGYPHEMRAADYDDWVAETVSDDGRPMHGLNGDILVWNHVTKRRHELMSGGIRVDATSLKKQLEMSGQLDWVRLPYHRAIINNEIPLSIGSGIGQGRTQMLLLKKAHLGEVTVTVWPKILKEMCAKKGIFVLE
jgi:aspartate--ammonia ligase